MIIDYLHTDEDDLLIRNGDFAVGESEMQEVGIILRLNPGELKSDPVLGPALLRFIRGRDDERIRQLARLHLERDGKNYEQLKEQIKIQ